MNSSALQQTHISQQGAVLIVALMFLIVLTMLGVSVIETTKLETKMAYNITEYNHAFQMAEVGLTLPLGYDTQKIIDLYEGKIDRKKDISFVRDEKNNQKYNIEYFVSGVEGSFPALPGWDNTMKSARYFVVSKGDSLQVFGTTDKPPASVVLRGGIAHAKPPSNVFDSTTMNTDKDDDDPGNPPSDPDGGET